MNARDLIRHLAHVAHRYGEILVEGAERHPHLGPLLEALSAATGAEDPRALPPEAWDEALWALLVEAIAERIVDGWDQHGAPSAARDPEGWYLASAEGPGGPFAVRAPTKRGAYQEARRVWVRRLLGG